MTKGVGLDEIGARIRELKPDVVAVSTITATTPDAIQVVELAKAIDPNIVTVAGGIHASFMYEDLLRRIPALDHVCIGEGEETLVELLDALAANTDLSAVKGLAFRSGETIVRTLPRPYLQELDNRPMAWDLLDWEDYTYFILPGSRLGAVATSRGCPFGCTFCSQQKFWRRTWRAQSAESVVREVEELHRDYGVDVVLFTDDYPTPDRQRWERMLDLLIDKDLNVKILMETRAADIIRDKDILWKYRKAGIIHIYVGTEAASQTTLDLIRKELTIDESTEALRLCREHGIITETSMILGFPDETKESIDRTIEQALIYNPDFAHFLAITPWPYADIYKELEPYVAEHDYRKYNLVDPIIKPKAMSLEQVDQAILDGYRRFYMGKFKEMLDERDDFKRKYMFNAINRMMNHSFIRKKMGMEGGKMPEEIRRIVESDTLPDDVPVCPFSQARTKAVNS
jgi:anaerobic magnesium-protoporphyrin IX monomethyl ester cyclase